MKRLLKEIKDAFPFFFGKIVDGIFYTYPESEIRELELAIEKQVFKLLSEAPSKIANTDAGRDYVFSLVFEAFEIWKIRNIPTKLNISVTLPGKIRMMNIEGRFDL